MNIIVKYFEIYLFEDGKSIKTIESYVGDVTGLIKYLESMGVEFDGTLKRFYITSYKNNLIENGYEPTTINKKINSFMSLNNYLIEKGYMNEVIIDIRKDRVKIASSSEQQVEVFSYRLVERILFYIQNQKKVRLRDRMIVQILMFTGVRVSELCDRRIKNIDFLTGHLKVVGKGGKLREVLLKPEVVESIKEYIVVRNNSYHKMNYASLHPFYGMTTKV